MKRIAALPLAAALFFAVPSEGKLHGGYSAVSPVTASPSSTSIYASWTETPAGSTTVACGTSPGMFNIPAVDNGTQTSVTAHYGIVAGLTPSTLYYCEAVSRDTFLFTSTTLAAPSSTAIASITIGTPSEPVSNQIQGDTFYSTTASDGTTYVTADDSFTFGNGSSRNQMVGKFTNLSPLTGTNVNTLSNFGTQTQCVGDTPTRSWKFSGLLALAGNLFGFTSRQGGISSCLPGPANLLAHSAQSIIMSIDSGVTWSNFQTPGTAVANGSVPSPASAIMFQQPIISISAITVTNPGVVTTSTAHNLPSGSAYVSVVIAGSTNTNYNGRYLANVTSSTQFSLLDTSGAPISTLSFGAYSGGGTMYPDNTMAAASPIMCAADDGTIEPGPSACRVDNMDAYVYTIFTNGINFNGDKYYLSRVPRAKLANLTGSDWQYFQSGDGNLDTNWSSTFNPADPILTDVGKVSFSAPQFVTSINRYIMFGYYFTTPGSVSNDTHWLTWEAQHPWSTWTLIDDTHWGSGASVPGAYNPVPLSATASSAGLSGPDMTVLFAGDYGTCCHSGGYYHLFTATVTLH